MGLCVDVCVFVDDVCLLLLQHYQERWIGWCIATRWSTANGSVCVYVCVVCLFVFTMLICVCVCLPVVLMLVCPSC